MIELRNGSKIIALPCGPDGATLRGYTADLVVMDEAAFMPEDVIASVIFPMLATTNGTAIMLSTLGVETTFSTEASKTRIIGASM
jgi:phage FluMu gp28-like protein